MFNTESNKFLYFGWAVTSIALLFFFLHFYRYMRTPRARLNGSDISLLFAVVAELINRGVGTYLYFKEPDLPPYTDAYRTWHISFFKFCWARTFIYTACLLCIKTSLLLIYKNATLALPRRYTVALYIIVLQMVLGMLSHVILVIVICLPVSNNWSLDQSKCNVLPSLTVHINLDLQVIVNNVAMVVYGVVLIMYLRSGAMGVREIIALCFIVSLGVLCCVACLLRSVMVLLHKYHDAGLWCSMELGTAIVVACLPGLRAWVRDKKTRRKNESREKGEWRMERPNLVLPESEVTLQILQRGDNEC